ncbi:hypothetical protein D9C73_001848 [Collichthys lucidus]|uniref:Secreted protein n=1 Tax=Collichthys lucidus TaxID=240159 RepID=A0A4U5TZ87_COLLU|nr:hypothetical protein D9C73_001848 [Collichthys lucidus]
MTSRKIGLIIAVTARAIIFCQISHYMGERERGGEAAERQHDYERHPGNGTYYTNSYLREKNTAHINAGSRAAGDTEAFTF